MSEESQYASAMAFHGDSSDVVDKEVLTWQGFGDAMRELAQQIADSGWQPDVIIAVARGGMLPAGALTYMLGTKLTDAMNVEFYTDVHETLPDPVLLAPLLDTECIQEQKLLVVDDVVDSGRTLELVVKLLEGYDCDVRSAVIYRKPSTIIEPTYTWAATDKWIVFPWSAEPPVEAAQ